MYEAIVLSGGGTKAVTLLGILYEWFKSGKLQSIKTYSVCSAGAFIAVLYLCGINPLQMLKYIPRMDNIIPTFDLIQTLISKAGIKRIQQYTKKVREIIKNYIGFDNCTLLQFHQKTGVTLYIEAVDVSRCQVVYFNHIDHPNIPLMDCVHASAAIPGVFIPIKIHKNSYIDGGYYSSIPLEPVMHLKTIVFTFKQNDQEIFLITMIKLHARLVEKEMIKRHKSLTIIECQSNFGLLDFDKTYEDLLNEFTHGRHQYK